MPWGCKIDSLVFLVSEIFVFLGMSHALFLNQYVNIRNLWEGIIKRANRKALNVRNGAMNW